MRRIVLILVCVPLIASISFPSWGQSDSDAHDLIGPVTAIETTDVQFVASSWGWSERNRFPSSRITFNESGNKTEELIYTGNVPSARMLYAYDTEGRLSGIQTYNLVTSAQTTQTFDCDEQGRLKEEITRNKDGSLLFKTVYLYGDSAYPSECMTYNSAGQFLERKRFTYTNDGQVASEKKYRSDGTLDYERQSVYGVHGKPVETSEFNGQNNLTAKYYYHYDESGNVFEAHCYSAYAKLNEKQSFAYIHDSVGN